MSVKTMTTPQLREDLATIGLTWPDGVPWEQLDRVNALKGELKRRGEEPTGTPPPPGRAVFQDLKKASDAELEAELRALSAGLARDPDNEGRQNRFADVRFELRLRAKSGDGVPERKAAPLPERKLELPEDDEVERPAKRPPPASEVTQNIRRPPPASGTIQDHAPKARPAVAESVSGPVGGFSAFARSDGTMSVEFELEAAAVNIGLARTLTLDQVDDLVEMLTRVRGDAAKIARKLG